MANKGMVRRRLPWLAVGPAALLLVVAHATAAQNPLEPLGQLIGGEWRSTLNVPGMDPVDVQMTFAWGPGKHTIRYTVVSGKGEEKQVFAEGIYAWHPGKKQIVFTEFGAYGSISEGTVTPVDGGLRFVWTQFTAKGSTNYRDMLRFLGENQWTTNPQAKSPAGWRAVMKPATYARGE